MAASYLGSVTIGGAAQGLSASFSQVGAALQSLNDTVSAQLSILDGASGSIRTEAVKDFELQVASAVSLQTNLTASIPSPGEYLAQLTAALAQLQANLTTLVPALAVSTQIGAAASLQASGEAKIDAVDASLSVLTNISAAITAALSAAVAALAAHVSLSAKLTVTGAKVFLYTGTLSSLGAGIDAVSASSGLSAGAQVRVPIIVVDASDAAAVAALDATFKTS